MKRGQVSIEFLSVFGFVFLMTLPLIILFFDQVDNIQDSIAENHIRNIAIKVTDKSEAVYYMGTPSKSTLKIYFPNRISEIGISGKSLVFRYLTSSNTIHEIVSVSDVNITGSLNTNEGVHIIEISSADTGVEIREKS